jgi:Mn-containing catalase
VAGGTKSERCMATQMQTLYTGTSGHLAVMAHFLHLGYNAAIPKWIGVMIFL